MLDYSFTFLVFFLITIHFITICLWFQSYKASSYFTVHFILEFPNSQAMGSCKTNRRTGAVGSPSELVGGWCPGHVLMASGSCDVGVPVMF